MNLSGILIGSEDPQPLVDYYTKLFGEPAFAEGGYSVWQLGSGMVTVGPHDEVRGKSAQPGRMIWNIESADVQADFAHLREAGANVIREPYSMGEGYEGLIATFSDPDDNYFQLMSPMRA
ncbi:MAG: VOC family protein [Chloroflexota bacterium]